MLSKEKIISTESLLFPGFPFLLPPLLPPPESQRVPQTVWVIFCEALQKRQLSILLFFSSFSFPLCLHSGDQVSEAKDSRSAKTAAQASSG